MSPHGSPRLVLFQGPARIANGAHDDVSSAFRTAVASDPAADLRAFDIETGHSVDLDPREPARTLEAPQPPPRRGRPRLGVTAREVTLLPRDWEWLSGQRGGASATLRRLVDEARKTDAGADLARKQAEAAYRFMVAMCGDRPGFEEASRALFAGDLAALRRRTDLWPEDIRIQVHELLGDAQALSG